MIKEETFQAMPSSWAGSCSRGRLVYHFGNDTTNNFLRKKQLFSHISSCSSWFPYTASPARGHIVSRNFRPLFCMMEYILCYACIKMTGSATTGFCNRIPEPRILIAKASCSSKFLRISGGTPNSVLVSTLQCVL
jgi:hypothetical protein